MCILNDLIPVSNMLPPEGVDLFVCGDPFDPGERTYGVMQYFKKGSPIPMQLYSAARTKEERFAGECLPAGMITVPAPESCFYFLDTDDDGHAVWLSSSINPLDAWYAVINPEDCDCDYDCNEEK